MVPLFTCTGRSMRRSLLKFKSLLSILLEQGVTISGRVFSSAPSLEKDNLGAADKNKVKQVVNADQGQVLPRGKSTYDDVEELLRVIKRNDYKVIDQLNQTPSKISILSLLLCSKAHRNALIKFLSATQVPQEINVNQFEGWYILL